jgi:hypothetical protein
MSIEHHISNQESARRDLNPQSPAPKAGALSHVSAACNATHRFILIHPDEAKKENLR